MAQDFIGFLDLLEFCMPITNLPPIFASRAAGA
jgi:hypothetical protein